MSGTLDTDIRDFLYPDDLAAVKRIWREVGWVDKDEEKLLDQVFSRWSCHGGDHQWRTRM